MKQYSSITRLTYNTTNKEETCGRRGKRGRRDDKDKRKIIENLEREKKLCNIKVITMNRPSLYIVQVNLICKENKRNKI